MTLDSKDNGFIEPLLKDLGRYLVQKQKNLQKVEVKGHLDLVTEADYEVEKRLKESIQARNPEDRILGEERERLDGRSMDQGRIWVIDPLDGTVNFRWGSPIYAISVGLVEDGIPVAGWVYAPSLNELFIAEVGRGAFLNGKLLVDPEGSAELLSLSSGFLREVQMHCQGGLEPWLEVGKFRNLGSEALQLCYVAAGRLGANINWEAKIWDDFAGAMVLRCAGCHYESYSTRWHSSGLEEALIRPEKALQSVACRPSLMTKISDLLTYTVWRHHEARSN